MPKSKRNKQISLTRTRAKPLELKKHLVEEIRSSVDKYANLFVFSVDDMRNSKLKDVREQWKHSRFFFGKNKVMALALGRSPEEEYKTNLHKISERLKGQCGLLFTNRSVKEVLKWFRSYGEEDFARSGNAANCHVVIPEGPASVFHYSLEPYLRTLGMPTTLQKGVVHLVKEYQVCKEGEILTPEKAKILEFLGHKMAEFRITIGCFWTNNGTFKSFKGRTIKNSCEDQDMEVEQDDKDIASEDVEVEKPEANEERQITASRKKKKTKIANKDKAISKTYTEGVDDPEPMQTDEDVVQNDSNKDAVEGVLDESLKTTEEGNNITIISRSEKDGLNVEDGVILQQVNPKNIDVSEDGVKTAVIDKDVEIHEVIDISEEDDEEVELIEAEVGSSKNDSKEKKKSKSLVVLGNGDGVEVITIKDTVCVENTCLSEKDDDCNTDEVTKKSNGECAAEVPHKKYNGHSVEDTTTVIENDDSDVDEVTEIPTIDLDEQEDGKCAAEMQQCEKNKDHTENDVISIDGENDVVSADGESDEAGSEALPEDVDDKGEADVQHGENDAAGKADNAVTSTSNIICTTPQDALPIKKRVLANADGETEVQNTSISEMQSLKRKSVRLNQSKNKGVERMKVQAKKAESSPDEKSPVFLSLRTRTVKIKRKKQ